MRIGLSSLLSSSRSRADDNKSSNIQEEEHMKEKSADVANNYKLMSNDNNHNAMLFIHVACK